MLPQIQITIFLFKKTPHFIAALVGKISFVLLLLLVCYELCARPVTQLQSQVPAIVKAVHRQLREKSIKTRQGCFSLLSELVQVLPGALNDHVAAVVPGIQFSLGYITNFSYNGATTCN